MTQEAPTSTHVLECPLGFLVIKGTEHQLDSISFSKEQPKQQKPSSPLLLEAERQLHAYFQKKLQCFDLPIHPKGTTFQQAVWEHIARIPFGTTESYGKIAVNMGDPKLSRAVGTANGKNPLAIVIPCHRIIGADGSLTGYASGLWRKKWLLEHESPAIQLAIF